MNKVAKFTYYGETTDRDRIVKFYRNQYGSYTCDVEGMPALTITHPSYDRVKAAFEGWYVFSSKDWGASEIDWGDMAFGEKEADWNRRRPNRELDLEGKI